MMGDGDHFPNTQMREEKDHLHVMKCPHPCDGKSSPSRSTRVVWRVRIMPCHMEPCNAWKRPVLSDLLHQFIICSL